MNARPLQVVRKALAAALVLVLMGAPVHAQQRTQEQKYVPSPFKLMRKALDGMREQGRPKPGAAATRPKAAGRPAQRGATQAASVKPEAPRLPKPRPQSGSPAAIGTAPAGETTPGANPPPPNLGPPSPAVAEAAPAPPQAAEAAVEAAAATPSEPASPPEAASPSEPANPLPALVTPTSPALEAAPLADLPHSFADAGLEPPGGVLPLPAGRNAVRKDATGAGAQPEPILDPPPEPVLPDGRAPAASALDVLARVPRSRPAQDAAVLALIDPKGAVPDAPGEPDPAPPPAAVATEPDDPECLNRLRQLGVVFSEEAPTGEGACRLPHPLKVASVGSGVAIKPEAILNCRTTEALALWVKDALVPAARANLGAVPDAILHGSTYVCRTRNHQKGAKLSEHAQANAVDIATIGFADRAPVDITIREPGGPEAKFSDTIRKASCTYFTTSLGPGTNASHATHFHFDMAQRRGGYRLCDMGETNTADRAPKPESPPAATERRDLAP